MHGGGEKGRIAPEYSKVQLEAKVWPNSSVFAPSEDTRGGKEEDAKLVFTHYAKCETKSKED